MTLTLPRVAHAGLRGPDVMAYKRTLHRIGIRPQSNETTYFGFTLADQVHHFQAQHGITPTGTVTGQTFDALRVSFDSYDRWLLRDEISLLLPTPRELIIGGCMAMLHHAPFPYMEVRPYPDSLAEIYVKGSDCSGTSTRGGYAYAHLSYPNVVPDPNAMNFDGFGNTYEMIKHGTQVATPKPGDLAFYYPAFSHVGVVLDATRAFSHGKPGDPTVIPVSWATQFRRYFD